MCSIYGWWLSTIYASSFCVHITDQHSYNFSFSIQLMWWQSICFFFYCSIDIIVCVDSRYVLITTCFHLIGHPQLYIVLTFILFILLLVIPTLASVHTMGVLVQLFRFFVFM
jgi:hypothetical protein